GLQRLVWKGETPFELVEATATRSGFALRFSAAVDPASVTPEAFTARNWTYLHHSRYGSPETDPRDMEVTAAELDADGRTVRITVAGRIPTRVHAIDAAGIRSADGGARPWHGIAWYTLNAIPEE
ncbi:MAG: hypothetical protein KDC48_22485, partial [Planctomycetes bacterium]|nr:hypothetical protein [Planctomycetota bacterium]